MCFECFKSKPAKEREAIGFNKHLLSAILRISLMRIMKSSETVGDIPEKKYDSSAEFFLDTLCPGSMCPSGRSPLQTWKSFAPSLDLWEFEGPASGLLTTSAPGASFVTYV